MPTPADLQRLTGTENTALAAARALVAEMKRIARSTDEAAFARATEQWLVRVANLFAWRQRERSRISSPLAAPAPGKGPGARVSPSRAGTAIDAAAGGGRQDQLLNATKQMQETQMSFNLQYLQLQNQMQHESRSYTAVSNIMKTKHDTVKNSISNVR